jgi:hypothetical protein
LRRSRAAGFWHSSTIGGKFSATQSDDLRQPVPPRGRNPGVFFARIVFSRSQNEIKMAMRGLRRTRYLLIFSNFREIFGVYARAGPVPRMAAGFLAPLMRYGSSDSRKPP